MHALSIFSVTLLATICTAIRTSSLFLRDDAPNCASFPGIDGTPAGNACHDPDDGIWQCAAVQCEKLDGKPMPGDAGMGNCAQCTCADDSNGHCAVSCGDAMAPDGVTRCADVCSTCLCNVYNCGVGGASGPLGGPNPGGLGGED